MEKKYTIQSIWYTKPRMTRDSHGEAMFGRVDVSYAVGMTYNILGGGVDKIESIEYMEDYNEFYIHFKKGGLLTVPRSQETEIYYTDGDKSSKTKQKGI